MTGDREDEWHGLRVWAGQAEPRREPRSEPRSEPQPRVGRHAARTDEVPQPAPSTLERVASPTAEQPTVGPLSGGDRPSRWRSTTVLVAAVAAVVGATIGSVVVLATSGGSRESAAPSVTPPAVTTGTVAAAGSATPSASEAVVPAPTVVVTQPAATVVVTVPGVPAPTAVPSGGQSDPPATQPAVQLPRRGAIVGIGGLCVDDNGGIATDGSRVKLWTCNDTPAQFWTIGTDGTLRVVGFCLRVTNNATVPGSAVEIWTCDGGMAQRWSISDDHIVNTRTGLCLASPGDVAVAGIELAVEVCAPVAGQRFVLPPPL